MRSTAYFGQRARVKDTCTHVHAPSHPLCSHSRTAAVLSQPLPLSSPCAARSGADAAAPVGTAALVAVASLPPSSPALLPRVLAPRAPRSVAVLASLPRSALDGPPTCCPAVQVGGRRGGDAEGEREEEGMEDVVDLPGLRDREAATVEDLLS